MNTVKISVHCPVCNGRVEDDAMPLDSTGTLWGTLAIFDQGCIEVTQSSDKIREHLQGHSRAELRDAYVKAAQARIEHAQYVLGVMEES